MKWVQAVVVVVFILVHVFAGRLRFLDKIPRSRWLSAAGGISVAYVFLHVFPELSEAQETFSEEGGAFSFIERHAYLIALSGLVVFYGLERLVKSSRPHGERRSELAKGETVSKFGIYCVHIGSFTVYNALIGYLVADREDHSLRGLAFFAVAMALHFLVNDFGLQQDHRDTYRKSGRWILAGAIAVGWTVGLATEVRETVVHGLFSFLAGGAVLNVLKEELPEERESRFVPFIAGAGLYAALLLAF